MEGSAVALRGLTFSVIREHPIEVEWACAVPAGRSTAVDQLASSFVAGRKGLGTRIPIAERRALPSPAIRRSR